MARTRLGKMPYVIVFCLVVVLVLLASGLGVVTDIPSRDSTATTSPQSPYRTPWA